MVANEGVAVERHDDWVVTRWRGDVDIANARLIEQHSLDAVQNTDQGVIVDLTDTSYIDSAGIRSLISIHRMLSERRQRLLLVIPADSTLRRAIEIAGVPTVIPTYLSVAEAKDAR